MKRKTSLIWILKRIRRRIPAILLMTGAHVGSAFLGVVFALGTRQVIDSAVAGSQKEFLQACLLQGGIIIGMLICITIFRHLKDRLAADLDRDWKRDLLKKLLHGEYARVSAYHSGELLNRLNNDVRTVNEGVLSTLPNVASMITRLISAIVVLIALEPWFALAAVGAGIAVVLLAAFLRNKMKGLHKKVSEEEGRVSGFLQETLEKLLMVQAMDVSEEMERRADGLMKRRFEVQRKRKNASLFANTSISVMYYAAGFVALVFCAFRLLKGKMSFGSLTAITQLVSQLQGPLVGLSGTIPQYIAMTASAERLMELEELPDERDKDLCDISYEQMTELAACNLSFSYERGQEETDLILDQASFSLPKGGFTVITGPSGIGKSTLLKLMLGIFKANGGSLEVKGGFGAVSLNRSTRKLFAYVPQGNLLLSGTLRENLLITHPKASKEEIRQAVYVSAMDEYLPQLPEGLDTIIGESGAGLSEGQAQRLAIARAILSGAPILLLDEGTSALDAETEKKVLERIKALPDRMCIAVTHRPAAVEISEWRLEMKNGKVDVLSGCIKDA